MSVYQSPVFITQTVEEIAMKFKTGTTYLIRGENWKIAIENKRFRRTLQEVGTKKYASCL